MYHLYSFIALNKVLGTRYKDRAGDGYAAVT